MNAPRQTRRMFRTSAIGIFVEIGYTLALLGAAALVALVVWWWFR